MSDQSISNEQKKLLENQAKKILDLLVKIAPIPQGVKQGYQASRETIKSLEMADATADMGMLSASDPNMNWLALIARRLSNELSTLNRRDVNWWLETSGANLFSRKDSTEALKRLQSQRQHLLNLREACDGLKTLAGAVFAQSVANVKGLAKLYVPSIPAIDGYVTKDTRDTFDVCVRLADSIVKKQETAIQVTADMTKAIDRFTTLTNANDQRTALQAIKGSTN